MLDIGKILLKAICNSYWCKIEYKKDNEITKFMIGINYIDEEKRMLKCDAFNLMYSDKVQKDYYIYFDKIVSAEYDDTTIHKTPDNLLKFVNDPTFISSMFRLSISKDDLIDYYDACFKLDSTPYISKFTLIKGIDDDTLLKDGIYKLSDEQFKALANESFYKKERKEKKRELNLEKLERRLCVNILSIPVKNKKYILAYRNLRFDIENKCLIPDEEVLINKEFILDGAGDVKTRASINKFIPEDKQYLLDNFYNNINEIKQVIREYNNNIDDYSYKSAILPDDNPYILTLETKLAIDIDYELNNIKKVINNEEEIPLPLKVFLDEPDVRLARKNNYPIFTVNDLYNIDQIKAINIAMKSPASYIQGPPGTGKTQTILNAIFTAIFNNKTVLVTSNNNIPMDGVYNAITSLKYNDKYDLLFPAIRLGSIDNIENAVLKIKSMYDFASKLDVRENQIKAIKEERKLAMKNLVELLDKHDKKVSINNRLEVLENIKNKYKFDNQFMRLTVDSQIDTLKKDAQQYESLDEDLTKYMNINHRQLFIAIHFETAGRLQKLKKEKYIAIYNIIKDVTEENKKERAKDLRQFLSKNENLQLFLEIFPVIISTNLSCTYLGEAGKHFDIVMMDEAAQCNITNALIPISRGNQIMLVGDAQQLSPVILLDENINKKLRAKYNIPEEYDYIKNSIYTAYTKIDVSNNEALLRDHYRCNKKIIQFSNQKYYNNMLVCKSKSNNDKPLEYFNTSKHQENSNEKNISEVEAKLIVDYIKTHPDEHVGVITPFVRQKECIEFYLSNNNIDVPVGTVHAFQGDQQNVILFSTAITNKTSQGTYNWLKNNKELINVAMSRAKDKFIMIANKDKIDQLSTNNGNDNIKELSNYVFNNGECKVQNVSPSSIALGTKHISSQSEEDLQKTISQILSVINPNCFIESEVAIDSCFKNLGNEESLFYKGRFDLVIFERTFSDKKKPILAVELNGPEHYLDEEIKKRDEIKKQICEKHGFQLLTIKRECARDYRQNKSAILELLK